MKILAISDVHSEFNSKFDSYLDGNLVDLLVVSGDITNFGPPEFAMNFLNNITQKSIPVIAIPGNCDTDESILSIKDSNAIFAHNKVISYENIIFYGFGGSNPTPFETPFEFTEDTLYNNIKSLFNKKPQLIKKNSSGSEDYIKILLTHSPPYGSDADIIEDGTHVGSKSIEKIINEFQLDLNLCGHIHEAKSISSINDTIIVNPGMLKNNHGILIDTKNNDLKVEIIEFI
jgi:Icc-related predicted phosphoesterase